MLYATKNLCPWYSMLSISPFQFFVSFCCVFIKFDTKFGRATLLEISFLHFRNPSLLHTLTQLAVRSDVLMLSSWNCTDHQMRMYVSAGVWGVATALPVVEPRIQCHYFPDAPRKYLQLLYAVILYTTNETPQGRCIIFQDLLSIN